VRVKITFTNGTSVVGTMRLEEFYQSLDEGKFIPWIMNDDRKFIPFIQPNGKEVMLNKRAISYIVEEDDEIQ